MGVIKDWIIGSEDGGSQYRRIILAGERERAQVKNNQGGNFMLALEVSKKVRWGGYIRYQIFQSSFLLLMHQ